VRSSSTELVPPVRSWSKTSRYCFSGQHLVQHDAQSIEVAAQIDGAIHSSVLFWRDIGQGSSDELGGGEELLFAGKTRGNSKTREPHMAGRDVDRDIRGFEIFADHRLIV
jgi:hypothetical protein